MLTTVRCVAAALLLASGALAPALAVGAKYDHVVVLGLENENFSTSWGPASPATYLNSLVPSGVFFDHYYATGHASLDNYIAMVSGQPNQPVTASDCLAVNLWECVQPQSLLSNGRNLADQLEEKGLSWKGYMDGMPSPCFHADYDPTAMPPDPYQGNSRKPPAKDYADRHNPFLYFADIIENDTRCKAHVRPYPELARDISNAPGTSLPAFSFITPDTCHDGHDAPCSDGSVGGMKGADDWLKRQVPPLLAYLKAHRGLLIITVDENGFVDGQTDQGCCSGGLGGVLPGHGGRIGLLALSPLLAPRRSSAPYDHMSLLRTIEDAFGIAEHLNNAASSSSMNEMLR
ncbi:MAG: phosphatidylinositol-3-phosphatase [Candidatus Binatota bacterium]|nr:phosphatidylinositol-3-phosphatase [Candidatus Binatota bacterium]